MNHDDEYYDGEFFHDIPARNGDPGTSQDSGLRIRKANPDAGRFSKKSRQAKLLALYATGQFTDSEAALRVVPIDPPGPFQGCRRRCSDLRDAGYVADTEVRRCNEGTPDEAMVCTITEAGRRALARLETIGWSK